MGGKRRLRLLAGDSLRARPARCCGCSISPRNESRRAMTASATYGVPACTSFDLCGVRRTAVALPPTARCTAVLSKHLPTSLAHGACRASACPDCCSKLSIRQCRLGSLCTPPARPLGSASPACSKSWAWSASSKRCGRRARPLLPRVCGCMPARRSAGGGCQLSAEPSSWNWNCSQSHFAHERY